MRRALAAILLAILTSGISAPVTCTGWEPSASDRMACCKRAHHAGCHQQSAADNCCARHEQTRQIASIGSLSIPVVGAPAGPAVVPAMHAARIDLVIASRFEQQHLKRLHGPPDLFSPPLRI